eukprot:TRINITY_DN8360_c0_g1_i1.p1 TRINITY_DN8360_c0_g1~~TRINITY_DN8360_c0_g1_i1.p1  ORF type:complete len:428 (+),score=85.28 TRINITY_DN8360_c0_g1_i1:121-1404(+)
MLGTAEDAKRRQLAGGAWVPGGIANPLMLAGSLAPMGQPLPGLMPAAWPGVAAAPVPSQPGWPQAPAPVAATGAAAGFGDMTSSLVAALQSHMPSAMPAPAATQPPPAEGGLQALLMASLSSHSSADVGGSSETLELLRVVQDRIKAEPGVKAEPGPVKAEPGPVGVGPVKAEPGAAVPAVPQVPAAPKAVKTEVSARRAARKAPKAAVKAELVDVEEIDDDDLPPAPARFRAAKSEAGVGDQAPTRSKMENDDDESDDGVPHRLPPGFGAIPEDIVEERQRMREEERMLQLKATQPCRFGRRCKKRDCPNAHPEGRDIDSELNPCAFGRRCKRQGCFYDHPEGRAIDEDPTKGMCKFGAQCARADCLYSHPEGRVAIAGLEPKICFFCHGDGHIATECPRNPDSWCYDRQAAMRAAAGEVKALTNG